MTIHPDRSRDITVTAIIATYNRANYLPVALDSILRQTRPPDEVIVVDDGSTDETPQVAARYGPRIAYHRQECNRGKPAALNLVIPSAKASHLWIFDDDDVALPEALQAHIEFLAAHPDTDFTYSSNYYFAGSGNIWQRDQWRRKTLPNYPPDHFFVRHALNMHAFMAGMLIPKRCFEAIGNFDPALLRCEDEDFILKLAYRYRAHNLGIASYVLREHSGSRGPAQARHAAAEQAALYLQYAPCIFGRMRRELPLSAYLPEAHAAGRELAGDRERRLALLQRGAILLQHGMTTEAYEDLHAALTGLRAAEADAGHFRHAVAMAFDVDAWRLEHPYRFAFRMNGSLRGSGQTRMLGPARRGEYWALRRALAKHAWRDAIRTLVMLALLAQPFPKTGRRRMALT